MYMVIGGLFYYICSSLNLNVRAGCFPLLLRIMIIDMVTRLIQLISYSEFLAFFSFFFFDIIAFTRQIRLLRGGARCWKAVLVFTAAQVAGPKFRGT